MRAAHKGAAAAFTGLRGGCFEVERVRRDFPILQRTVHGKPLVYLDNAATSQKPQSVIDSLTDYYAQTTPTYTAASIS